MNSFMKGAIVYVSAIAALVSFNAHAAGGTPIISLLDFNEANQIQDQSGENVFRETSEGWEQVSNTTLVVGDILAGVFTMDTVNDVPIGNNESLNELTGVFLAEITSVNALPVPPGTLNDTAFTFGVADTAAWDDIFGITTVGGDPISAAAMLVLFEDSSNNFAGLTNVANAIATATDGIYRTTFGFDPADSDHFWNGTGPGNTTFPPTILPGVNVGTFQFGLDVVDNDWFEYASLTDPIFGTPVDYELYNGAGQLFTPGSDSGFEVENDYKGTFIPAVPEPATLALMGLGLVGFGASRRRRAKKA